MPADVGQRLLNDPEGVTRDLVGQPGKVVGMETDRDAGPLGRLPHQGLDGGLEAKLVEYAGPELAGAAAHDLHRLVDTVGERRVAQSEDAGIGPGLPALEPGDVELQGGERLAQLVMNLPRHPGAFLLAGRLEPGGEGPQLGPGRSEERRVGKECRSRWSPYH